MIIIIFYTKDQVLEDDLIFIHAWISSRVIHEKRLIHFIHFKIAGLYGASCREALLFRLIKEIQVNSRIKVRFNKQEMDCNKYFG